MVGAQEAALDTLPAARDKAPPWPVVVVALLLGGALVLGTTMGGYLLTHEGPGATAAGTPAASPGNEAATPPETPVLLADDWRVSLTATTCDAPCAGGDQCMSKPINCRSGLSCIPGIGSEPFADDESWMLHLSAVREKDDAGRVIDPCASQKDFWVCRSGTSICASQGDACSNAGRALAPIPTSGAELERLGLTLEVHLGGPTGPVVAVTEPIRNLRRGGLCNGYVVKAKGGRLAQVSYFLLPPIAVQR